MGRQRMVAAELTQSTVIASDASRVVRPRAGAHARRIAATYAVLWAFTAVGTLIGRLLPSLGPGGRPHPSLHGSLADFAAIVAINARVLSAPFLLVLFRFPSGRRSRQLGDLLIIGLLAGNALRVGLALGHHGDQLLQYVPQLPVEWLAAALAGGAWLTLRTQPRTRTAIAYVAAVLALVGVAAAIETLATPRASPPVRGAVPGQFAGRGTASTGPRPDAEGRGWFACAGSCAGAGSRFKVASLPSPRSRSVPLSRLAGAAGLRQPPPDPAKEGPRMNAVHLTGRLTQDVTAREHGDTKIAQLRLAVPRGRDKNGQDRGADFVDVVCFGRQAQVCADYLANGRRIAVDGRLHHDEWESDNGRRQKLEVIASSIEFLDARKAAEEEASEETEPVAA